MSGGNFFLFNTLFIGFTLSIGEGVPSPSNNVINVAGIFTSYEKFNDKQGIDHEGIQGLAAFKIAIHEINERRDILPNHILNFTFRNPVGFYDTTLTMGDIQKYSFNGSGVHAFITGIPEAATDALNDIINERFQKIYITTTAGSTLLSSKETGSFHIRTSPADSFNGMALQDIIYTSFGYRKISIFYSFDEISLKTTMEIGDGFFGLMTQLSTHGFQVKSKDFSDHISAAKLAGSQIFIICTDGQTGARLLEQGYNQGLFREGTQIFGSALLTAGQPWKYMSKDADVLAVMKGYIGIMFDPSFHLHDSQEGKDFVSKFRSQKATVTVNSDGTETCD
eukprot:gene13953-29698_t